MVYEAKGYNFKILTAEDDIDVGLGAQIQLSASAGPVASLLSMMLSQEI
jgi:hypothetical protein